MVLCGVAIPSSRGLAGTSDGDVALHAVIDAILGGAALGDLGDLFPSSDPVWQGSDSRDLLGIASARVEAAGFEVTAVDVTIVSESVIVTPHRSAMRAVLAETMALDLGAVSVKATTTDGLGFVGRGEGLAATAVATLGTIAVQA